MTISRSTPHIVTRISRPDRGTVAQLGGYDTATVHESDPSGLVMGSIQARTVLTTVAGPAVTCLNRPGDNLMIHAGIEQCDPGDVLVIAVTAPCEFGMFGELLATLCQARGIAGVIVDSGVRDTAALREMGFPVWSRSVTVRGTTKTQQGWVNVPVTCGGTLVRPGDVVVADGDGVVVVPGDAAGQVAQRAAERVAREQAVRSRLSQGELTLDVGGLRERLPEFV